MFQIDKKSARMLYEVGRAQRKAGRSAWDKGLADYIDDFVDTIIYDLAHNYVDPEVDFSNYRTMQKYLLNGARDWQEFSEGGCSLVYDEDIARRLCSPSEFKRCYGKYGPNSRESWIDVQARALRQASQILLCSIFG